MIGGVVLACLALAGQPAQPADGLRWFRGQLHAHTYWSDGRGFPEQAVAAYQQSGFDFLCISDHNRFADDTNTWREVADKEGGWPPKVMRAIYENYVRDFGAAGVDVKTATRPNGAATMVRLKTFQELQAQFEQPGKFILLPGVELTQKLGDLNVHLNYINLPRVLPCIQGAKLIKDVRPPQTVSGLLALNAAETARAAAELRRPYALMLNHPFWRFHDIVPAHLVECSAIRFFEICNNGADFAPYSGAAGVTPDKFWDVVNAFRRLEAQPLLYGVGSDDAHFYDDRRIQGANGVGNAWVMVRAAELTPEHLLAAMHAGDFYATCGVLLEDLAFAPSDKTLRVRVQAAPGAQYQIHFITTKRDFERTVSQLASPAEKKRPARTIPIYADDIGRVVKTVAGVEAEYCLEADDLYVRARVESNLPAKITPPFHPQMQTAWTQPYPGE